MNDIAGVHTLPPATNPPSEDSFDPQNYTTGRWLRRDKEERDARYISFDFNALRKKVVALCPGATSIVSSEKKEGGFNRVFIFTLNNGKRLVARLPTRIAGPCKLTTNSEVATMQYLQSNTTVPIPTILDWSDDASNAIGSEYIIMEHAVGLQLHQRWPTMSAQQRIGCIKSIFTNMRQIAALTFPAYGSLYFADTDTDTHRKVALAQGFCIGPHCGTRYWDCNVGEARYYGSAKPNRGAWMNLEAYCDGLIDTGLSRVPSGNNTLHEDSQLRESVATHIRLLGYGRDILHKLSEDPRISESAAPTLWHADLHKRNVFVSEDDPTTVTGFIDWQSSSIEPTFEYADETPDFARSDSDLSSEDPSTVTSAELCKKAYDICLQGFVPRLAAAKAMDENLIRPFRYCHRTWKDGAAAFRQELIELSSRWEELGLPGRCPYPLPNREESAAQRKEYEDFVEARNLNKKLASLLNTATDGWVPTDCWEATKAAHREAFEIFLQEVREKHAPDDDRMSEEKLRQIWPFDTE
ncbi:MAG: hypothetical protein Q9184_004219 [Pyrenodesmia sp. 2 TL-2023]